jgi:hypothetical protein
MSRQSLVTGALLVACSSHPAAPGSRPVVGRGDPPTTAPVRRAASFCPPDTEQVGAEPPVGEVIWCEDDDGRKQGPYRSWYDSGELEEEGQFKDGARIGVWHFFDEKGEPKGSRTFRLRVRVKLCVYEKSSRRALERALLQVINVESGDTATSFTDTAGIAVVEIDSGRGRIEVEGMFPRFEVRAELDGGPRSIPIALDSASVQKMQRFNMGRLSAASPCAKN